MIVTIQAYIERKLKGGMMSYEVADLLGISNSMVSNYKAKRFFPSIEVAVKVYKLEGLALHPFAEESLLYEIERGNKHARTVID